MNTLGYRLFELLKAKDMTQKELAYTIGVSEVSISRYVNNARKPRAIVLYKMAEVLGVSVEYLLTGNKNMEIEDRNRQIMMRSDIKLPQPFASWSNSL